MTAVNLNPDLAAADRRSLFNACTRCATDGLVPDGREAALVCFGRQVQYMPMVFGIIKKLRQSGEIASISARIVYENEVNEGRFKFIIEDGQEKLVHEPLLVGERGKPVVVYATAKFKDGTIQNEPMTVADIEKVRNASRAKNAGPWKDWWDEMARKTAIRRLSKYLPLSAEDRRVLEDDEDQTEFASMKSVAVAQPQDISATAVLGLAASEQLEGDGGQQDSQQEDADGADAPEPYRLVLGNEITDFTDPTEFMVDLSNALAAAKDRPALTAIEESNREVIARLSNDQKFAVAETIDEAGKRIDLAGVGKRR